MYTDVQHHINYGKHRRKVNEINENLIDIEGTKMKTGLKRFPQRFAIRFELKWKSRTAKQTLSRLSHSWRTCCEIVKDLNLWSIWSFSWYLYCHTVMWHHSVMWWTQIWKLCVFCDHSTMNTDAYRHDIFYTFTYLHLCTSGLRFWFYYINIIIST